VKWKGNTILAVFLVILCGWYYFYELRGSEIRETEAIEQKRLFPGLIISDLLEVSLKRIPVIPDSSEIYNSVHIYEILFQQIENKWQITSPVKTSCNPEEISYLLDILVNLCKEKSVAETTENLDIYGLESPAFIIRVKTQEDTYQLYFGNENPSGDAIYVTTDSIPQVFLISNTIRPYLMKKVIDYRERKILSLEPDLLTNLNINFSGNSSVINLHRSSDGWMMSSPLVAAADENRIDSLIEYISSSQTEDFIDEPGDLESYGLAEPSVWVDLITPESTHVLSAGTHADAGGKLYYAQLDGKGPIFTVEKKLLEMLRDDPFYYRSKKVCHIENSIIHRIRFERKDEITEIQRNADELWEITLPRQVSTDSNSVSDFLSNLTYLRGTGVSENQKIIGSILSTITLYDDQNTEVTTISIGDVPADGVGRWVRTSEENAVFRISDSDARNLLPGKNRFRDLTLLSFNRDQLKTITFRRDDRSFVFEPSEGTFRTLSGNTEIDASVLEEFYWLLHELRINDIVVDLDTSSSPADLERFGFQDPRLIISVSTKDSVLADVLIGSDLDDSEHTYIMRSYDTFVGTVETFRIKPILDLNF